MFKKTNKAMQIEKKSNTRNICGGQIMKMWLKENWVELFSLLTVFSACR